MDSQLTVHNDNRLGQLGKSVNEWQLLPAGTEGTAPLKLRLAASISKSIVVNDESKTR